MNVEFVLTATGNISLPRIDHCIFAIDEVYAKTEGARVAKALSKAGYSSFNLYDVRSEDHSKVCSFFVKTAEPEVETK